MLEGLLWPLCTTLGNPSTSLFALHARNWRPMPMLHENMRTSGRESCSLVVLQGQLQGAVKARGTRHACTQEAGNPAVCWCCRGTWHVAIGMHASTALKRVLHAHEQPHSVSYKSRRALNSFCAAHTRTHRTRIRLTLHRCLWFSCSSDFVCSYSWHLIHTCISNVQCLVCAHPHLTHLLGMCIRLR